MVYVKTGQVQKSLCRSGRSKSVSPSLSLPGWLVRILRSIIRTLVLDVFNARYELFHCDTIATEPVGDNSTQ